MKNFLKGILVGIFNIAPGLSGSLLLIALDLYDRCIESISNIFSNPKKSFMFLFPIALGIIIGTYLFANIIFFFINNFRNETYIVFTFLIIGTLPNLISKTIKKGYKKKYLISFFIAFAIGTSFLFLKQNNTVININYIIAEPFKNLITGSILSFSAIIPCISSTILLSIFNLYESYIYSIKSLDLNMLIPISIGFVITTILISKIINYLLKKYYSYTYFSILGFFIATIPSILKIENFNFNTIISILIGIIMFLITYFSFKVIE